MRPQHMQLDQITSKHLGPSAEGIAACLHPEEGDCQTCVQPLHSTKIATVVDVRSTHALVSLHHQRCRKSVWNDTRTVSFNDGETATYSMSSFGILDDLGRGREQAMVILNPWLESVRITNVLGSWYPFLDPTYAHAGLLPAVKGPIPVATGITASINARGVIEVVMPNGQVYPSNPKANIVPEQTLAAARKTGEIVLVVTQAVNPRDISTLDQIHQVMHSPMSLMGIVPL